MDPAPVIERSGAPRHIRGAFDGARVSQACRHCRLADDRSITSIE